PFLNVPPATAIYTLSLHAALPIYTTTTTRQSRKGAISSWKAYAPAFAGKLAVEAVDRAMRGEGAPSPIYEGEDGVIARLLSGPEDRKSTRLNSSHVKISYAVFCLK